MRPGDSLLAQLSAMPWFGSMPLAVRRALLSGSQLVSLRRGQYLFRRGDEPMGFHGVVAGKLKAATLRADGKEAILSILEPGCWFGEASMINGNVRIHDVSALAPSTVLTVGPALFEQLMQRNAFARAICVLLSWRTNMLFTMIEDATLHSVRVRIAHRLLWLARGYAAAGSSSKRDVRVSQDTLAMMLGITRQTLALELKELAAMGAVALRYGRIEIISPQILAGIEHYAGGSRKTGRKSSPHVPHRRGTGGSREADHDPHADRER